MTRRDEVMAMAKEAFASRKACAEWFADAAPCFERFADMVGAAERERCAKFCAMVEMLDNDNALAGCCADGIRALKDEVSE